jgi:DNA-directed RNA polymerase specialized sigma24 family protein
MSSSGSVTRLVGGVQAADKDAVQQLWERYFQKLARLAKQKLRGVQRRAADEEDVALSALDSFFAGARRERFPKLRDRHDLWRLLVVITKRKAADLAVLQGRKKRGGGAVRGDSALSDATSANAGGFDHVPDDEPTPDFIVMMAEECQRLLDRLGSDELRDVARWRMEGYTNAEIATKLGCVEGTVERKVRVIRSVWEQESHA